MDPYVLDVPYLVRRALVSLIIVPTRSGRSAEAYGKIWRSGAGTGSPLIHHMEAMTQALAASVEQPVALAMRYGNPRHQ